MHIFYEPHIQGDSHYLSPEEAHHASNVLRVKEQTPVLLTDGKGVFYEAITEVISKKQCMVQIQRSYRGQDELPAQIHIAIAPTKQIDRFEWFLEKATEIGISRITPIVCEHSERVHIKTERLQKILIAAMKQSQRSILPVLDELTSLSDLMRNIQTSSRFIAYCGDAQKDTLNIVYQKKSDVCILIGPEGDFSPDEVAISTQKGFKPLSFGQARLRTETAGIVAVNTLNLLNNI